MIPKAVYANLWALQPWKARPWPMLKRLDGSFARTPAEIAGRWIEHFSLELGGAPSSFDALMAPKGVAASVRTTSTLWIPSLHQTLDSLLVSRRGRALRPDVAPIELVQVVGLPAAVLLHGLVAASCSQNRSRRVGKVADLSTYLRA